MPVVVGELSLRGELEPAGREEVSGRQGVRFVLSRCGDIGMGVQAELQYLLLRLLLEHVAFCSVPCWDLLKIRLPLVYL